MKACLWCAEQIQDAARICRHCGRDASANGQQPILNQPGLYNVPFRVERQSHGVGNSASGGFSASSTGIAFKGSVCPSCRSGDYATAFSIWHGILAIFAFPIGLIGLAFPIKRCVGCGNEYGAGKEMTRVLAIFYLCFAALIVLVVLIGIGAAANGR